MKHKTYLPTGVAFYTTDYEKWDRKSSPEGREWCREGVDYYAKAGVKATADIEKLKKKKLRYFIHRHRTTPHAAGLRVVD